MLENVYTGLRDRLFTFAESWKKVGGHIMKVETFSERGGNTMKKKCQRSGDYNLKNDFWQQFLQILKKFANDIYSIQLDNR